MSYIWKISCDVDFHCFITPGKKKTKTTRHKNNQKNPYKFSTPERKMENHGVPQCLRVNMSFRKLEELLCSIYKITVELNEGSLSHLSCS